MQIKKTLETPEGRVTFEGELSADELEVIIGIGLNYLLSQGALPFKVMNNRASFNDKDAETLQ